MAVVGSRYHGFLALWLLLVMIGFVPLAWAAEDAQQEESNQSQVISAFTEEEKEQSAATEISDREKRLVMFSLGAPLLVLLMVTVGLGVALGIYGKPVFVAHMVCAGLSMTLAIAHAIVGIVWFYPF